MSTFKNTDGKSVLLKMVKGIRKEAYDCEKYVSGKSMDEVMA